MGRKQTEKTKRKISESLKKKWKNTDYNGNSGITKSSTIEKLKETWTRKLFEESWKDLSYDRKRRRLIIEQDCKCNKCGLDEWLDNPIKLEFEHIDGDRTNNVRENCEALCPNCHSMTDTWRGLNNVVNTKSKIKEHDYVDALKNNNTISDALRELGLAPKGGNYKRAKKLIMKYNI